MGYQAILCPISDRIISRIKVFSYISQSSVDTSAIIGSVQCGQGVTKTTISWEYLLRLIGVGPCVKELFHIMKSYLKSVTV